MFNLSEKSKHHRFHYHTRNHNEKKERAKGKRLLTENEMKTISFDPIKSLKKNRQNKKSNLPWTLALIVFCILPFFFSDIYIYMERKYSFGGIATYFLLILLCFIFIRRNKKRNE
jgi:hypothetical protein